MAAPTVTAGVAKFNGTKPSITPASAGAGGGTVVFITMRPEAATVNVQPPDWTLYRYDQPSEGGDVCAIVAVKNGLNSGLFELTLSQSVAGSIGWVVSDAPFNAGTLTFRPWEFGQWASTAIPGQQASQPNGARLIGGYTAGRFPRNAASSAMTRLGTTAITADFQAVLVLFGKAINDGAPTGDQAIWPFDPYSMNPVNSDPVGYNAHGQEQAITWSILTEAPAVAPATVTTDTIVSWVDRPTNVVGSAPNGTTARLTWTHPYADQFEILKSPTGGVDATDWTIVARLPAEPSVRQYDVTALGAETNFFAVRVYRPGATTGNPNLSAFGAPGPVEIETTGVAPPGPTPTPPPPVDPPPPPAPPAGPPPSPPPSGPPPSGPPSAPPPSTPPPASPPPAPLPVPPPAPTVDVLHPRPSPRTIWGTAPPGLAVQVYVNGVAQAGIAYADQVGDWQFIVALSPGTYTVTALAVNAAGVGPFSAPQTMIVTETIIEPYRRSGPGNQGHISKSSPPPVTAGQLEKPRISPLSIPFRRPKAFPGEIV